MKFSTLIAASGTVATTFALPQFLPTAGAEWTPQEWVAPGANDCKFP